jgi:hypothetical protein
MHPASASPLNVCFTPRPSAPVVRYAILRRQLGKMPSTLRRAAIDAAYGAVSAYLSHYSNWLDDTARARGSRAPRLGISHVNAPRYGGNMIRIGDDWRSVHIKLPGADGIWSFSHALAGRGRMKRENAEKVLCPSLL